MWQWSGGGGTYNGYGDLDQIDGAERRRKQASMQWTRARILAASGAGLFAAAAIGTAVFLLTTGNTPRPTAPASAVNPASQECCRPSPESR